MGILTRYELYIVEDNGEETEIYEDYLLDMALDQEFVIPKVAHEYAGGQTGARAFIDALGMCIEGEPTKWYGHRADMIELSKANPTILFKLHGEGEEAGDIWNQWHKNGKSQEESAVIQIPEYDPRKMS